MLIMMIINYHNQKQIQNPNADWNLNAATATAETAEIAATTAKLLQIFS